MCYNKPMKLNIQIPDELYDKIGQTSQFEAVFESNSLVIKPPNATNLSQNISLRWTLVPALISAIIAFIIFQTNQVRLVSLVSDGFSVSEVAAFLGVISGLISFMISMLVRPHITELSTGRMTRIRNFFTLTIAHTILLYAFYSLFFYVIDFAFIGAKFDPFTASWLILIFVAIGNFSMIYAALTITFARITTIFSLTTIGGLFLSMITNANPNWWQINFSFLGTQNAGNKWQFNLTLIFSSLLMLTLTDYIFGDIIDKNKLVRDRYIKLTILRVLFSLICTSLALIGTFENVAGSWLHTAHNFAAKSMVALMLVIILLQKWLVPKISKEFLILSYAFAGFMIALIVLFMGVHYISLTAFEILGYGFGFTWLVLCLQNLKLAFSTTTTYQLNLTPDHNLTVSEKN